MEHAAVRIEDGNVDPPEVGSKSSRPDHGIDFDLAPVREGQRALRRAHDPWLEGNAVALRVPCARSDQRVAIPRAASDARLDRLVDEPRFRQPPEEIASEQPLRQRCLPRPNGEVHGPRRGQLHGDLEPCVAAADDHDRPFGNVARTPVARAVHLDDVRRKVGSECRHVRGLKRAGRNHNLLGLYGASPKVEHEASSGVAERLDLGIQVDWQLEGRRVLLEVADDLVARGIAVRVAREGKARKAVIAARCEQHERVPAPAPRRPDRVARVEDREVPALFCQEVPHGEPGLPSPYHRNVESIVRAYFHVVSRSFGCDREGELKRTP